MIRKRKSPYRFPKLLFGLLLASLLALPASQAFAQPLVTSGNTTICPGGSAQLTVSGGTPGNAMMFNRAAQNHVLLPNVNLNGNSALTIEAWVRPTDITTHQFYNIVRYEPLGTSVAYLLAFQNNGSLISFGINTTSGYTELDVNIAGTGVTFVNQWHHVAGVYDGTTMRLYIDCQLVGTTAKTGTVAFTPGGIHRISGGPNGEFFQGLIDNVRLWDVARTATQVCNTFDCPLPSGTPGIVGDWRLDECTGNTAFDNSPNNNHGTLVLNPVREIPTGAPIKPEYLWSPSLSLNQSFGEQVTASPNTTTTYTVTSRGVNCLPISAQVTVSVTPIDTTICLGDSVLLCPTGGTPGNAMHFDRADKDRINLPKFSSLHGSTSLTVEAWVHPTALHHNYYNIIRRNGPSGNWLLAFQNNGVNISFGIRTSSGYTELDVPISTTGVTFLNQWHHLSGVWDGSTMRLYVDGVQVGQKSHGGTLIVPTTGSHRISNNPNGEFFQGWIDNVRLWSVARSPAEVLDWHDCVVPTGTPGLEGAWRFDQCSGTTVLDYSGNNQHGQMVISPTRLIPSTAPIKPQYTFTPHPSLGNTVGACVWAKPTSTTCYTYQGTDVNCNPFTGQLAVAVDTTCCDTMYPFRDYHASLTGSYDNDFGDQTVKYIGGGEAVVVGQTDASGTSRDLLLFKVDPFGNTVWSHSYGFPNADERGYAVEEVKGTTQSGFIAAGWTTIAGSGQPDIYVVRTDLNGTLLWGYTYTSPTGGSTYPHSIQQTQDGGFILGGISVMPSGSPELHVLRIDPNGTTIFNHTYQINGLSSVRGINAIVETANGHYVATYTATGAIGMDAGLIRLDAGGNFLFGQVYPGNQNERAHSVIETDGGDLLVAGYEDTPVNGHELAYLMKVDAGGQLIWRNVYQGKSVRSRFYQVVENFKGEYVAVGMSMGTDANEDAWLVITDPNGNVASSFIYADKAHHSSISIDTWPCGMVMAGIHPTDPDRQYMTVTSLDLIGNAPCGKPQNVNIDPEPINPAQTQGQIIPTSGAFGLNISQLNVLPFQTDCANFQKQSLEDAALAAEASANSFLLYPNPVTKGQVIVEAPEEAGTIHAISLFNLNGQVAGHFDGSELSTGLVHRLDVSELPAGIYFLRITSSEMGVRHIKFTIQ